MRINAALTGVLEYFYEVVWGKLKSFPIDKDENLKEYEATQRQRAIERSIRSSKRGLAALDSAIQSTDDKELKAKLQRQFDRKANTLKNQEARLAEHCKSSGLLPRSDRTRVVGFGRNVGQKAVQRNKKYLAQLLDKSIIDGTIDSKKYSEMLKNRIIVDNKDLKNGLPIKGKPNSIADKIVDGKVSQRRIYGSDGLALVDFDTHDHNQPKAHPTGAHKQVFNHKKKNPHGVPTGLTDQELDNNNDIIKRGVNYFDPK